jgi:hypothetical protein
VITLGEHHNKTHYAIAQLIGLYEDWGKPDMAAQWQAKLPVHQ